jgi:hypothetical protein
MVNDIEARNAVRELMKRFDSINEQHLSIAYVLAKRDSQDYARLLESAERAASLVMQPLMTAETQHNRVYAALDDPDADWPKAVFAMLTQGPIVLTGDIGIERLKLVEDLEARFDAENDKGNKGS